MKIIVTCGPSYEPIDDVRRITNFSTGELGVLLTDKLAAAGFDVCCLERIYATYGDPKVGCVLKSFTTNDDLHPNLHLQNGGRAMNEQCVAMSERLKKVLETQ